MTKKMLVRSLFDVLPRVTLLSAALLTLSLSGCMPEADAPPELHDIAVYSNATDLQGAYGYFYGAPTSLQVGTQTLTLTDGVSSEPLAVASALLVDGQPYLKTALAKLESPPTRVQHIPLTSDVAMQVGVSNEAREVVYFDGSKWFTLASEPRASTGTRVVPKERLGGLIGLGELTQDEANMLERALQDRAPVAVTLLPESRVPTRQVSGLPNYRRTALYVQQTIPTDASAYTAPVRELLWDSLASGNQAASADTPSFQLITTQADLVTAWNRAYGSRLTVPPLPDVNFPQETVLAVFSATQPTGGYSLEVQDITLDGNDLYIDLLETEPAADAITTQALTSPWLLVRVLRGDVNAAWFREPGSERIIGVARRGEK